MTQRGYSLLEVMISMLILAIAFLALIATQLGTLNGYVSARDAMEAAELGRRTSEIMHIEGTQWINNVVVNPMQPPTFASEAPYDTGGATPFDVDDPIAAALGAADWIPLVDTPVDVRFNRVNADISTDHLGGKFCIYAKGGQMTPSFQSFGGTPVVAAMRFQIAVVYPGPRATLINCALGAPITVADLNDVGDRTAVPFEPPPLERIGMRVAYFGTIVVRHAFLAP